MSFIDFYNDMLPLRVIAKSKPAFCMLLFYNIISDKNLVATDSEIKNQSPKPKYASYIRSTACRPINRFAYKIHKYRSKEQFEIFLTETANYPHIKKELFKNFTSRYPERNITMENLFVVIADIFDKLIDDAAKEYENSPRNNPRKSLDGLVGVDIPKTETPSANNEVNSKANIEEPFDQQTVDNSNDGKDESAAKNSSINQTIKRRHAEKIDKIIDEIIELMKSMVHYYDSERENESFKSNYYKYYELNSDLCGYALTYPFIESIKNIPMYLLKETDFFVFNDSNPYLVNYVKYKELLIDIRKEITALDEV